jgi:hypothetical protein
LNRTLQPTTPYAYEGTSSISSSQFTAPISSTPSIDVPKIQEADVSPSRSAPAPPPPQQPAVKKTKRAPEYNQPWLAWYKVTKDENDILKTLNYKVSNCKKPYFVYKQSSGMTSFKRHIEMHQKKGEVPSENAEPRQIQTLMQLDGTRTHPKFNEPRMLSEMTRYITHKEQPISMGGCMSFVWLVIRGCS